MREAVGAPGRLRRPGAAGAAAVGAAALATAGVLAWRQARGAGIDVAWLPSWGARLAFRLDGLAALYGLLAAGVGTAVFGYATAYLPRHLEHDRHRRQARLSALMALLVTGVSAVLMLIGILVLRAGYGTTSVPELFARARR